MTVRMLRIVLRDLNFERKRFFYNDMRTYEENWLLYTVYEHCNTHLLSTRGEMKSER